MADWIQLALVALDAAVYVALGVGILASRRISVPSVDDPDRAFSMLEVSVKTSFPDLRDSFTWREALARAKKAEIPADWGEVFVELDKYEAYKYGGEGVPVGSVSGVVGLAAALRSRGVVNA